MSKNPFEDEPKGGNPFDDTVINPFEDSSVRYDQVVQRQNMHNIDKDLKIVQQREEARREEEDKRARDTLVEELNHKIKSLQQQLQDAKDELDSAHGELKNAKSR